MEEIIKGLAQFGLAGIMGGALIWLLYYIMTKMVPDMMKEQAASNVKIQETHAEAMKSLATTFERTVSSQEARSARDEERCERRHVSMMNVMERCAVKIEELSYDIDLIKSQLLIDPNEEVRFPAVKKKGNKAQEHQQ